MRRNGGRDFAVLLYRRSVERQTFTPNLHLILRSHGQSNASTFSAEVKREGKMRANAILSKVAIQPRDRASLVP